MKKSISQNDIEAKNDSLVQNGKLIFDTSKYMAKNDISPQKDKEEINVPKTVQKVEKVKEKTQTISQLLAKVAVVAVASVTGVVAVPELIPSSVQAEVVEFEHYETDTEISYYISLDEYVEGITIVLYNDFTNREQEVEEQMTEGVFENLKTNMQYTLAVKQGANILAKKILRTKTKEEWEKELREIYGEDEPYEEEPIIEDDWPEDDPNLSDDPREEEPIVDDDNPDEPGDEEGGDDPTAGYIG